jgi:uncharacterized OsmC-like protein
LLGQESKAKMTILSTIIYEGSLRTTSTHLKSGVEIQTDAPTDNNGKGACFSPTDMVANSLGTCMITLMGIGADKNGFTLGRVDAEVIKEMEANPRRISAIRISMKLVDVGYTTKQKKILETAARTCPVAKSLHPDIDQDVQFEYVKNS